MAGSLESLFDAIQPHCSKCKLPATRFPSALDNPEGRGHVFCDQHELDDYRGAYQDLPHAIPVRQLLGTLDEEDRVWCLKVVPPKDQLMMGPHLMMVHEKFVVVRAAAGTSREEMENVLEATQTATGTTEVLVISEGVELEVVAVVEPRSRYERLMADEEGVDAQGD